MAENKPTDFIENIKNKFFGNKREISSEGELVEDYKRVSEEKKINLAEARLLISKLNAERDERLEGMSKEEQEFFNEQFDKNLDEIYSKIDKKELFKLENAEDYVDLVAALSPEQYRLMKIEQEYGSKRFDKFRAYLKGEYDFKIEENGDVKKHAWYGWSRKALNTVFNRRTALQAGATGVIGIFTGGVSLGASAFTFLGSALGRGGVELVSTFWGKEGQTRRELTEEYTKGWKDLRKLGKEIHRSKLTEEEKNAKIASLVEAYCNFDTTIINKKEELKQVKKETDVYREKWSKYGAFAGLGTSFLAGGLAHLKELVIAHKLNFDTLKATHDVVIKDGQLAALYNSAEELAKAKAGYMLKEIDPKTGQEIYEFVSKHGVDVSKILPIGEHGAHAFKGDWWDYARYFYGVGMNFAREGAVAIGTYIAGIKSIVEAGKKSKSKEEQLRETEEKKAKVLGPHKEKMEISKTEAEARAREPYNQANEGDQWILYFEDVNKVLQPCRVEIKKKTIDPRTNEEIIIFNDIDNTGLMRFGGKIEHTLDYTREQFNRDGVKMEDIISGKWEHKNYTIDEWQFYEKKMKDLGLTKKEDIENKYVDFVSKDVMSQLTDKEGRKLEDTNYKVFKIDDIENEIIIYDEKVGTAQEDLRKFKLTTLLHKIKNFEKETPEAKKEPAKEAEKEKTDIEKANAKLEERGQFPEGIEKIEPGQCWKYQGNVYKIESFSKNKKAILAWKLIKDQHDKYRMPQMMEGRIDNLADFANNAEFTIVTFAQERQEKKQGQRNP